jgi:hypothetical protein
MKVFRYWKQVSEKRMIRNFGFEVPISCWGGSNESEDDAHEKALEKIKLVVRKIEGEQLPEKDYTAEIREEILKDFDTENVVTRNRYGAEVLNSQDMPIIDVDKPKIGFFGIFKSYSFKEKKQMMLEQAIESAKKFPELNFRIYETRKGYRVIVANKNLRAGDSVVKDLFKAFNCDPLYASLCRKQDCFRARLTPKPSYIKHKGKRFKFPMNSTDSEKDWIESYADASKSFSTCHLVKEVGPRADRSEVIEYHDEICKVRDRLPLG